MKKKAPQNIKVLFVLKRRTNYGSYGLMNSCNSIAPSLEQHNIQSKVVIVTDGNGIDKEVHDFNPDFVILEAIWCPPYKIEELLKLYPNVRWDVRIHSKLPFLAQESIAFKWMNDYNDLVYKYDNFSLSANNRKFVEELNGVLGFDLKYTPNTYPIDDTRSNKKSVGETLDIGCFGALRILKNHLEQAAAAIYLADRMDKYLRFHINDSSTYEREGHSILNNLTYMFKNTEHELIVHPWENSEKFIKLVKTMDIGMQVSFSESFNLVAADFVNNGIPIVGSSEIEFLSKSYQADPNNYLDIADRLKFAIYNKWIGFHAINKKLLSRFVDNSIDAWLDFLQGS